LRFEVGFDCRCLTNVRNLLSSSEFANHPMGLVVSRVGGDNDPEGRCCKEGLQDVMPASGSFLFYFGGKCNETLSVNARPFRCRQHDRFCTGDCSCR
jgi:hypothetical protein